MNITSHRFWFLGVSSLLVTASLIAVAVFGLKPGIDLKGGTEWHIRTAVTDAALKEVFEKSFPDAGVTPAIIRGEEAVRIRIIQDMTEGAHRALLANLKAADVSAEELNFTTIGPSVGKELGSQAVTAIVFVVLGISIYVAWAFRKVSEPVSSWKYGLVTMGTLLHDVAIPSGLLAVLGAVRGVEIDTNFIVALLVIMGFSVHDTIVVFDRIRENVLHMKKAGGDFAAVINQSVRETMGRSVNTSLTLIIVLVALLLWGPSTLFYFILTILVGTVVGTYSSIFVASPLVFMWHGRLKK